MGESVLQESVQREANLRRLAGVHALADSASERVSPQAHSTQLAVGWKNEGFGGKDGQGGPRWDEQLGE